MIFGIVAHDQVGGIGKRGKLPWPVLKRDMEHFRMLTRGKTLLMGRKTFDSLPAPLEGRKCIVITNEPDKYDHGMNLDAAKEFLEETPDDAFIIGGGEIYKALEEYIEYWYITVVQGDHGGDTFILPNLSRFEAVGEILIQDSLLLSFREYRRKNAKNAEILQLITAATSV